MFGVGPGALPSDAFMMGIDPLRQREMMDESLEAIVRAARAGRAGHAQTDWFTLRDARLQLRPYSRPHIEMAVAAQVSPAGARAAGKYGLGLLSLGATTHGRLRRARALTGASASERPREHGQTVDRAKLAAGRRRCTSRETREQAREGRRVRAAALGRLLPRVAALPLVRRGRRGRTT